LSQGYVEPAASVSVRRLQAAGKCRGVRDCQRSLQRANVQLMSISLQAHAMPASSASLSFLTALTAANQAIDQWFSTEGTPSQGGVNKSLGRRQPSRVLQHGKFDQ